MDLKKVYVSIRNSLNLAIEEGAKTIVNLLKIIGCGSFISLFRLFHHVIPVLAAELRLNYFYAS
jgi:hypothetical protein